MQSPFSSLLDRYCYMPGVLGFFPDILKPKKDAQFTASGNDAPFSYKTTMGLAEDKEVGTNKCTGTEWWRFID